MATFFLGMAGCSTGSLAILDAAKAIYNGPGPGGEPAMTFNPRYGYLRTVADGRVLYLVLAYIDPRAEGPVEVWVSGTGEVIRLLDGQVVGTSGLDKDWREVRLSTFKPSSDAQASYVRERDVMPGYRFGIRDQVTRVPIAVPASSRVAGVAPASLSWFEERTSSVPADAALPPARFGVSNASGTPVVIYSEQCLSRDLCLSFERWTPTQTVPVAAGK